MARGAEQTFSHRRLMDGYRYMKRCSAYHLGNTNQNHNERFSICGTWALVGSSGPEIKLVSPALAGRLFTTEPPGKL